MHTLGTVLQDRYRVEAILGQGGMGYVYLARHLELDRMVAVKELISSGLKPKMQEAALRQFRQEALILHRLEHPRLPRVLDFFEIDHNPYLVMEYIKGRTLQSVVDAEDELLPESLVRRWAAALCEVLEYLHTNDPVVVFRDLKPGNIMLDADGDIKMIDFGISKIFDSSGKSKTNTFARNCISPGFTPPEQYAGRSEPRSDIYSLGASLYYLLTRTTPADAVQRAADPASLIPLRQLRPEVSTRFALGIDRLMAIHANGRPADIQECRQVLGLDTETRAPTTALSDWKPTPIRPPVPRPRFRFRVRPTRAELTALSLLALAAVGLLAWPALHAPAASTAALGTLQVSSNPPGATVNINRQLVGLTPLTVSSLTPGQYHVDVEKPGFETTHEDVDVRGADTRMIDLALATAMTRVPIVVTPTDAVLVVDGALRGELRPNASVELSVGRHQLEFSHAGYRSQAVPVEVGSVGPPAPVEVTLVPTVALSVSPTPLAIMPPWAPSPVPEPSSTSAFAAGSSLTGDGVVQPGLRVGPFALKASVQPLLDQPHKEVVAADGRRMLSFLEGTVWIAARSDLIESVYLRNSSFRTSSGLGPGVEQAFVEAQYGVGQVEPQGPRSWVTYPNLGVAFAFHDQHIAYMLVGQPGDDLPRGFLEAARSIPLTDDPSMVLDTGK